MLTFDPEKHVYHWEGKRVPNVTSVLAPLSDFSFIKPEVLENARLEGQAVHFMAEHDCKGDLDVEGLPEWMAGCYQAWCKFKEDTGFECMDSERRIYHPVYEYAGTPDLAGIMPKLPKVKDPVLIDIKRSFYGGPVIGLQTAAYQEARNKEVPKDLRTKKRFALRLDKDGKYRLQPFEDPADFSVFLACLTMYRWRNQHGK